jgi:hypothetical protein
MFDGTTAHFWCKRGIKGRKKINCPFWVFKKGWEEQLMWEDDLPDLSQEEYSEWYKTSVVPCGVGCRIGLAVAK